MKSHKLLILGIAFTLLLDNTANAESRGILNNKIEQYKPVEISELLPNPVGKDTGNEWVELFNNTGANINLNGWKIKSATKEKQLNSVIAPYSYITISFQLNNTGTTIKILNGNTEVDSVTYGQSLEGKSYSKSLNKWSWTDPTKSKENGKTIELNGLITQEADIDKDYFFYLDDKKIIFVDEDFEFTFIKTILKKGTHVKIIIEEKTSKLKDIQILSKPITKKEEKSINQKTYLIPPFVAIVGIIISLVTKAPS